MNCTRQIWESLKENLGFSNFSFIEKMNQERSLEIFEISPNFQNTLDACDIRLF